MKNLLISLITCSLIISCSVGEAMVIDSDWAFKKNHKIRWGEDNCSTIRDNEELQKLHAYICPTFKSVVTDSLKEGAVGASLRPRAGYYKKAAEIFMEKNKPSSCSIVRTQELLGKYDMDIKNYNYGWIFYYECE